MTASEYSILALSPSLPDSSPTASFTSKSASVGPLPAPLEPLVALGILSSTDCGTGKLRADRKSRSFSASSPSSVGKRVSTISCTVRSYLAWCEPSKAAHGGARTGAWRVAVV